MAPQTDDPMERLAPLLGAWSITMDFPRFSLTGVRGRVGFERMGGFLLQRWEVEMKEAPDGLALIGPDRDRGGYLQHYFDARGVARIYRMGFSGGVWTLSRDEPDHSPLDFRQRWTGRLSPDGDVIAGPGDICLDGETWEHDFDLRYERIG